MGTHARGAGKEHVILVAVDVKDNQVVGCVEVREMQGYLRPRALKDVPKFTTQSEILSPRPILQKVR